MKIPRIFMCVVGALACCLIAAAPPAAPAGSAPPAAPSATAPAPAQKQTPAAKPQAAPKAAPKAKREAGLLYGRSPAPKKAPGTIRLGAYNMENFFDGVDDPNLSGEYDDIKMQTSESRCKALAKAIHDLDADVLGLEEVEGEDALKWFRDTYLKDMGYEYLASKEVGYYRGVEQSLLSRFPIQDVQIWTNEDLSPMDKYIPKDPAQRKKDGWGDDPKEKEPLKFQRSPLKAVVKLPDGQLLTLYVVHHKAGGKATAHHRDLEALRINEMIKEDLAKSSDALVAVVGDFNSTPSEKPARIYRDKAFAGLVSAYEFRPEAGQGKESAKEDDADDDTAKPGEKSPGKSVAKTAAKNLYLTHITNRAIDYILMSPGLMKLAVPKSFFVMGTLMPGSDYDYKKDTPPEGYASDHCPIAIDLNVAAVEAKPKTEPPATPAAK